LRASEGFVENFGARLLARVASKTPGARLHFLHKLDKDSGPLRDGTVDLEWKRAWSIRPSARKCARNPCFATATWLSFERGTR